MLLLRYALSQAWPSYPSATPGSCGMFVAAASNLGAGCTCRCLTHCARIFCTDVHELEACSCSA